MIDFSELKELLTEMAEFSHDAGVFKGRGIDNEADQLRIDADGVANKIICNVKQMTSVTWKLYVGIFSGVIGILVLDHFIHSWLQG